MKHNIIKTPEYLLVVDDSEIKVGDYVLSKLLEVNIFGKYYESSLYKKIIAHLPLNNSPILQGVDLLPPLKESNTMITDWLEKYGNPEIEKKVEERLEQITREDDVEKMAKETTKKYINEREKQTAYLEFIEGHNKAKEKYKYTEEDILDALEVGFELGRNFDDDEPNIGLGLLVHTKDTFIQSLSQPKTPIAFECEYTPIVPHQYTPEDHLDVEIKTTTNSQGQVQLVGRYIYE